MIHETYFRFVEIQYQKHFKSAPKNLRITISTIWGKFIDFYEFDLGFIEILDFCFSKSSRLLSQYDHPPSRRSGSP